MLRTPKLIDLFLWLRKMKKQGAMYAVGLILVVASVVQQALSVESTAPAFLWSPNRDHTQFLNNRLKHDVHYQTLSPKDLAKSVLHDGGWSSFLCEQKEHPPVDLAIILVGTELKSSDIVVNRHADPALVDLLKLSFTSSNFSMAFPYVAPSEEDKIENSLVRGFRQFCGHGLGIISGAFFLESCSIEDESFKKISLLNSVEDYLVSRKKGKPNGQTDLVVFCLGGSRSSKEFDQSFSPSKMLSEIITSADHSGEKYEVLYVSDPSRPSSLPYYSKLERFLVESASGNGLEKAANFTLCDEVCQSKSALVEGLVVGFAFLIILLAGLCCMMGIDTPTRFEAPQDS